jgi:hypothetical protein
VDRRLMAQKSVIEKENKKEQKEKDDVIWEQIDALIDTNKEQLVV